MHNFDWSKIADQNRKIKALQKTMDDEAMEVIQSILKYSETLDDDQAIEYLDNQFDLIPDIKPRKLILMRLNYMWNNQ